MESVTIFTTGMIIIGFRVENYHPNVMC